MKSEFDYDLFYKPLLLAGLDTSIRDADAEDELPYRISPAGGEDSFEKMHVQVRKRRGTGRPVSVLGLGLISAVSQSRIDVAMHLLLQ